MNSEFVWTQSSKRSIKFLVALVIDVEAYPHFVPHCHSVSILKRQERHLSARLVTNVGLSFLSDVSWDTHSVHIEGIEKSVRFKGIWHFERVYSSTAIQFSLNCMAPNMIHQALLRKSITWVAPSVLQAFIRRSSFPLYDTQEA